MRGLDHYRDPEPLQTRLDEVRRACSRRWTIMDVCGGQTHNLLRHGIEDALSDCVELIHGPGCPVCVTPATVIDLAIELALTRRVTIATFGDMLRVPGRSGSLLQARARGGAIRTIYCPSDAVQLAQCHPDQQIVLIAVGFETTAPSTALAVLQAEHQHLTNFSVLSHHVRVEPAMRALAAEPERRLQGFLAAGHVCTVTGYRELEPLAEDFQLPVSVTGFEPLDLADGLLGCVQQLEQGRATVENRYARCVRHDGNPSARCLMDRVFAVDDLPWRGFGVIPKGGLILRREYEVFDARRRFNAIDDPPISQNGVDHHCAAVLSGRLKPCECPLFARSCTPDSPQGAPMVSSEGACAAYFRYAARPVS